MSYAKRAAQAAREIISQKPGRKGKHGVVINILSNDKEIKQMIDHLPKELHRRVMTAAVKAAAEIVETEASVQISIVGRRNIPYTGKLGNSRKTGTRELWSKKMAASRVGPAGNDMSKAVTRKTLKYRKRAPSTAIVGTDYYQYNFGHIHEPRVGEGPARHVMWGRDSGKMHMQRPWLAPAAKSTIMLQRQAMIRIIKARMKRYLKP
ncbi:MAG: hypothetical protein ACO22U_08435 [bacterium]